MVAFMPTWLHGATAPRWALMSVAVPLLVVMVRPAAIAGLPFLLGAAAVFYAATSLAWTSGPYEGLDQMWHLMLLAGLFALGGAMPSLRPVYVGAGLGLAINGAVAIAQLLGFDAIPQMISVDRVLNEFGASSHVVGPGGLFINRNFMAEPAALVLIGLLGWRQWWLAAAVLPAALLPGARGALLALAAAGVAWIWRYSRMAALIILLLGLAAAFWLGPGRSISARFEIWRDTLDGLTWWGHGLGSFFVEFAGHATHINTLVERPTHAHNDLLEIVYDLGLGALPFLGLMGLAVTSVKSDGGPEKLVLIAFLTEACFGYPLYLPATASLAAVVAGHLCAHRLSVWDGVAKRRAPLHDSLLGARPF